MKKRYVFLALLLTAFVLQILNTFFSINPFPGLEYLKALFPALLLAASFLEPDTKHLRQLWFFRVGLFFCILGDYFLGIPNTPYFYPGMAGFALGYLSYALTTRPKSSFPFVFLVALSLSALQFLTLNLGDPLPTAALTVYMLIISFLLAGGWSQWLDRRRLSNLLAALGFSLIYISDSLIGQDVFGFVPIGPIPILLTYAFAQPLVTLSFWKGLRGA